MRGCWRRAIGIVRRQVLLRNVTEILSVGVEGEVSATQRILSIGRVNSMISSELLNYFKWQIPDGSRVRLTLIQEDDLELLHEWKGQVDIPPT